MISEWCRTEWLPVAAAPVVSLAYKLISYTRDEIKYFLTVAYLMSSCLVLSFIMRRFSGLTKEGLFQQAAQSGLLRFSFAK